MSSWTCNRNPTRLTCFSIIEKSLNSSWRVNSLRFILILSIIAIVKSHLNNLGLFYLNSIFFRSRTNFWSWQSILNLFCINIDSKFLLFNYSDLHFFLWLFINLYLSRLLTYNRGYWALLSLIHWHEFNF